MKINVDNKIITPEKKKNKRGKRWNDKILKGKRKPEYAKWKERLYPPARGLICWD